MPPTHPRVAGFAVVASLALALGGLAGSAVGADSPEAVVNELFDSVETGDFGAIDSLVCEAERASVAEVLDPGAAMGMETDTLSEALTFVVEDRGVEVTHEDGEEATVQVTGTMSMNVDEDEMDDLARTLIEADLGEDISEEDMEMMLPFIRMAFSQSFPLDRELTLIMEDGEWVICGGLGEPVEEDLDFGPSASVSSEGACALATPEELTALGQLEFDSSQGFETFCSYSNSDFESYHSTSVSIELDADGEYIAGAYGADQALEVAGSPAWAPGPDGFGTNLITQAGADIIMVTVGLPENPPEDFDWLAQATLVTELLMPRLAEARAELAGPTPEPTPVPEPEVPLCPDLSLEAFNGLTGLGFDEVLTDGTSCQLSPLDMDPGFHFVYAYVSEADHDMYRLWIGDHEEAMVAGLPALITEQQVIIELPGGASVLDITVSLDPADESLMVSNIEVATLLAERILPGLSE